MRRLIALGAPTVGRALPAKARVAAPAIGAAAAAQRAFKNDPVALFHFMDRSGVVAELLDAAENLMAENDRVIDFEFAVEILNVGAADAAHFHLHQSAVRRNVGKGIL